MANKHTSLGNNYSSICRLGLATRGNTSLPEEGVQKAFEYGINYFNWCGHEDGMSRFISSLSIKDRNKLCIAVQLSARGHEDMKAELDDVRHSLNTEKIDVATFYYVEEESEWEEIKSDDGALSFLKEEQANGRIGLIGITGHQRLLLADIIREQTLDLVMVRYNAAHRKAETEVFPAAENTHTQIVAFTCQRWGALTKSTPEDPEGFIVPSAPEWYRFALHHPQVNVALASPNSIEELDEILNYSALWEKLSSEEQSMLEAHGDRVHKFGGEFP